MSIRGDVVSFLFRRADLVVASAISLYNLNKSEVNLVWLYKYYLCLESLQLSRVQLTILVSVFFILFKSSDWVFWSYRLVTSPVSQHLFKLCN